MTLIDSAAEFTLSPPENLRDLGGIQIAGGVVRSGFALRSDDLALADARSAAQLVEAGLTTVIDLRSTHEVQLTGRGPLGEHRVSYHHVPFMASIGDASLEADDVERFMDQSTFAPMYVRMFEDAAPQIVTALAIIAYAPGTVAFHCAAGQDRTGVLAAALLLALGADPDGIVTDYGRTGARSAAVVERIGPVMRPLLARYGLDLNAAARKAVRAEFSSEPMRGLLATLSAKYSDPLEPLRTAGLSESLVRRLRERALAA